MIRPGVPPQPLQIRQQIPGSLVSDVAVVLEQLDDHPFELVVQSRVEPRGGDVATAENLAEDDTRGRTRKGRLAGRHLVHHDAEREEVRARVQLFSPHLLGGHVGNRADGRSRAGQAFVEARGGRHLRAGIGLTFGQLGEAEIQDLGVAAGGDEEIRRLDVAMDDPCRVRHVEGVDDLDRELRDALASQWIHR